MKHVGTGAGARAVRQKMLLNPYLFIYLSLTIIHAQILTSKIMRIIRTKYFEQITNPRLVGTLCLNAELFLGR